jgi:zinc/manganese transport system permease protein
VTDPLWRWPGNPVAAIDQMWSLPFMVNAFRAGTLVAVLGGLLGWFVVARRQTFAAHTLSVVGFPGAAGATLIGVPVWAGYLVFCGGAALVLGLAPSGRRSGDRRPDGAGPLVGTVQAVALACGFLFVSSYGGLLGGTTSLLFGSFLGITTTQVGVLAVVTVTVVLGLAVLGRRLLFATIDPAVAAARGIDVRAGDFGFLALTALAVAAAVQVTGALLVFTLLVLPAATAQRLTARPAASLGLSVAIGLVVVWVALAVAFYTPYPFGFWLATGSFVVYLGARLRPALRLPGRALPARRPRPGQAREA